MSSVRSASAAQTAARAAKDEACAKAGLDKIKARVK